jgi:hypothetical protein
MRSIVQDAGQDHLWHIDSAGTQYETHFSAPVCLRTEPECVFLFACLLSSYHIGDGPDDRSVATCKKLLGNVRFAGHYE